MRISDWSSDVCSSDLSGSDDRRQPHEQRAARAQGDHGPGLDLLPWQKLQVEAAEDARQDDHRLEGGEALAVAGSRAVAEGEIREALAVFPLVRSEERRVGEERVSVCGSRGWPLHIKKKTK